MWLKKIERGVQLAVLKVKIQKGDMPSSKECLSQKCAIKCRSYTSWKHKRLKQIK